jgi:drug/metabolite transporter (DMT)-like permease
VKTADVSPETAAIFRCVYALPVLGLLAWREDRKYGARETRDHRLAAIAGLFFAADLIFWHYAIEDVGAGLATVLGNLQAVMVALAAWAILSERPERRVIVATPLALIGVLLISGALEDGAYGANPLRGVIFGVLTAITYTGFILVLRQGSSDLRRPAGPLFDATLVSAIACLVAGLALGRADLVPSWPEHAWLLTLALTSQVVGWLLIAVSLPRLPAAIASLLLTVQPVGSVILGVILLGENPSELQVLGVAFILGGLLTVAAGGRRKSRRAPAFERA